MKFETILYINNLINADVLRVSKQYEAKSQNGTLTEDDDIEFYRVCSFKKDFNAHDWK